MEDDINNNITFPCQRNGNKQLAEFWINTFFLVLTLILSLLYIISVLGYVRKNYKIKPLLTYWFDYLLLTISVEIFLIIYFIQQIQFFIIQRGPQPECYYCTDHSICYLLYFSAMFALLLSFNNIVIDMMKGFMLIRRMNKVSVIQTQIKEELFQVLQGINIKKIVSKNYHRTELIISLIVYGTITILYISIFVFMHKSNDKIIDMIHLFVNIFRYFIALIIIAFILMFCCMKHYKSKLLEKNYYSLNLIMQIVYNSNSSKLAYYCDFITYKSMIDCIGNIPLMLFLLVEYLHIVPTLLFYLSVLLYEYYAGVIFIYMDKPNKTKKSLLVRRLFCLNKHNVHFGEREREQMFQEFNFDYSDGEINELKRFNVDLSLISDNITNTNDKQTLLPIDKANTFDAIIYFLIFKMLYLFFQNNEAIYTVTQKKMDQEGFGFTVVNSIKDNNTTANNNNNNFISGIKERTTNNNHFENRISRISRLSRLSKINEPSLITSFKFGLSTLINTLQEKEFTKAFKRKYEKLIAQLSDHNEEYKIEFKIESLFSKLLYGLFPFYQLAIKDLLKSISPTNNKTLFMQFIDSIREDITYNEFYTTDSFLSFEIYDQGFISYDQLKDFFERYEQYLLDILKNFKYTYLPLIIGVFSIRYLDFNKIIILYRNELSFTSFLKLNHWIKFSISETPEEISVSQKNNDIIDLNEIEMKNNIKLTQEDYNEVAHNLKNDINFIKALPFKVFPKIYLFVGNQINPLQNSVYDSENENSSVHIEREDPKAFGSFIRDSINLKDNSTFGLMQKKEFGSEMDSLFERVYEVKGSEGRFIIKIYFALIFRENCILNIKETNPKYKLESGYYCDHIQHKVLTYLDKAANLFSKEEESKEDELII